MLFVSSMNAHEHAIVSRSQWSMNTISVSRQSARVQLLEKAWVGTEQREKEFDFDEKICVAPEHL